ncbi:hypothetical protein GCM10010319_29060 [Streptomyces blastmyceticus]|uniref:DUF397 domain-containing protein n=1 Tax=Streptomyces blastmyceticus TaxID=68180 RepID=A0ABN0WYE3_9ACTN
MEITWLKSSYSADTGNCLEIARRGGDVFVRESDDPETVLRIYPEKLQAFLMGVKTGKYENFA